MVVGLLKKFLYKQYKNTIILIPFLNQLFFMVKLSFLDRVMITTLFPREWTFSKLIIRKDVLDKVEIKQQDFVNYEIVEQGWNLKWNPEKTPEFFDIEFTELENWEISENLRQLSNEWKMTIQHIDLYRKFVTASPVNPNNTAPTKPLPPPPTMPPRSVAPQRASVPKKKR